MRVISRVRRRLLTVRRRANSTNSVLPIAASEATLSDRPGMDGRRILSEAQVAEWNENGYLVLPRFMPHGRVRELNSQVDALWRERKKDDHGLVIDAFIGTSRQKRIPFAKATDRVRAKPYKLNDLYLEFPLVRETILDPELVEVLDDVLEGAPIVANTVNFERGSQQRVHCASFTSVPPVPGGMVSTVVLLEDTKPGSGPLRIYPGSHLIAPYVFSDGGVNLIEDEYEDFDEYVSKEIADRGLLPLDIEGKAGDVLILHSQLANGGTPIEDLALTQKVLVTHYFRARDVAPEAREDIGNERYILRQEHRSVD